MTTIEPSKAPLWRALSTQGVVVDRQCGQGFCGACKVRLVSGEVKYATNPLAYVGEGEVLTCCTIAVTQCRIETL
ncbi:2Fe-2S iron-sulfur cluster binding domain-containing protein (plasmid) [Aeromonas media]|uniref:2Fe-2S iron-sulfur cluster binding domain-containing protein n=1 Tax=Aeromonas media TaxID=651 RepID=A0ABX6NZ66_AERME|nr:2Fe-2S iron-sulfur cluster-binding protein [Aeromonas media]HAT2580577.1 2Fe-2S iron-sulfur cluster binding domain-containing protein [Aeromonas hydrophila]HDT5863124.1 2Fe-2S iron-sulfur cluster binding domain-containing protein [Aeromonas hydrophila subsp. hydrophila]QJT37003.1 2Fe-2S iron-sulfur cluster binding domain-containing protein [Aeromonas media]QJT41231.1 2Fe-2S iron-sulfur cluster binding domain-containing protein [Aeromonas media]HAT2639114.1 2Fe-2S iron-sulfur cluster binding